MDVLMCPVTCKLSIAKEKIGFQSTAKSKWGMTTKKVINYVFKSSLLKQVTSEACVCVHECVCVYPFQVFLPTT